MRSSKIFLTSARITSLLCLSCFHMARSRCWDTELKCCSFLSTVRTWCTECSCFLLPTLIYFPLFHLYYIHPNTYSDDINAEIATVSYRAVCSLLRWQSRSPERVWHGHLLLCAVCVNKKMRKISWYDSLYCLEFICERGESETGALYLTHQEEAEEMYAPRGQTPDLRLCFLAVRQRC